MGGINRFIPPLSKILIKPNWVTDKHYSSGAVTNTNVIKACTDLLLEGSAKHITIADSAMIGKKTDSVIRINEVDKLASKRVDIVDLNQTEYMRVAVPNALKYRRLSMPKVLMESDVVINMPVMKTHDAFPFTLGLKNMKGALLDNEKRKFHSLGLDEGLIDLNKIALADFTLIDGSIGMEGNGPVNGTPVNLNILIASDNALAAEVVAIKVMGFGDMKPDYIQMAYAAGFGEIDLDKIQIVGEKIEDIIHPFESYHFKEKRVSDSVYIHDETACSGCRDTLVQFMSGNKITKEAPKTMIVAGDYNKDLCLHGSISIGIGKCLQDKKDLFDAYVPGCAPSKKSLDKAYQDLININMKNSTK